MARSSRAIAKETTGAMALVEERPDHVPHDSGRGNEGVTTQDLVIPRIAMIQDLSPQRKKTDPEYIEGAEEGMVFNTASKVLYGKSVVVIPVLFRKEWVIWKDRKKGGGFRGAFHTLAEAEEARAALEDGNDCESLDVAQHFVIVLHDNGSMEDAVISMSKSQMKISRQMNTLITMEGGDRWSRAFEMSAVPAQNSQGQDFFNWSIKQLAYVTEGMAARAEAMYEGVKSGARDVQRDADKVPEGEKTEY